LSRWRNKRKRKSRSKEKSMVTTPKLKVVDPKPVAPSPYKSPILHFTSEAWNHLLWLRDRGDTEVSAFGYLEDQKDNLVVESLIIPKQECSSATTEMDDESLSELGEAMTKKRVVPWRYTRVWIHTHPGESPTPSSKDWETFREIFGRSNWAIMFVLAKGGQTHCQMVLRSDRWELYQTIPCKVLTPVGREWEEEYRAKIETKTYGIPMGYGSYQLPAHYQDKDSDIDDPESFPDWSESQNPETSDVIEDETGYPSNADGQRALEEDLAFELQAGGSPPNVGSESDWKWSDHSQRWYYFGNCIRIQAAVVNVVTEYAM